MNKSAEQNIYDTVVSLLKTVKEEKKYLIYDVIYAELEKKGLLKDRGERTKTA